MTENAALANIVDLVIKRLSRNCVTCTERMYDAPTDINECKTGRNTCANDTVCFNLEGGYDCRCPHGHNCTGDCIHDNKVKHSGQIWVLDSDRCSVCSCQVRSRDGRSATDGWDENDSETSGKMNVMGVKDKGNVPSATDGCAVTVLLSVL